MQLIQSIVYNPVKVSVGVLLIILFSLVALMRMPMQLTPEVQRPTITVETRWPGASPQEIEKEIILEQEEQLKSVEGLTKLTSTCSDSQGEITLEFQVGTNMDQSLLKVNSRLQQVPEYPEDADQPVISTSNVSDRPIAWFILSTRTPTQEELKKFQDEHPELKKEIEKVLKAKHNAGLQKYYLRNLSEKHEAVKELLPYDQIDVNELKRFTEDEIESRFERVEGVSQSNVFGGLEEELQVRIDPEQLAARQLTLSEVRDVLRGQNIDVSAGDFWEGKRRWVVRTTGQFNEIEDVENQLLAVRNGGPVYVRDVAEVVLDFKKPTGFVRRFGENTISVNVLRETGANVLEIMEKLRSVNDDLNNYLLKSRGLELTQVYDETDYIISSVDLVKNNIFIGGALTMIVLMLFLDLGVKTLFLTPMILLSAFAAAYISPWYFLISLILIIVSGFWFARGALVVGLAIPTSIIGTFLILELLGRSLNVISLAGLAFAVGMLVDNAVVVLENIYRRYSSGEPPYLAAVNGTKEVMGAVFASTLTTVAVFLPVVFVEEEAGQLFRDIALAISASVSLSLIVSMTLIPTASARLMKDLDEEEEGSSEKGRLKTIREKIIAPINYGGALFSNTVVQTNNWIQKSSLRRLLTVLILVGTSFGISWALWPKVEYLPSGNKNLVFTILLPPPGYNLNQMTALGEKVEKMLLPYWDIDPESPEAAQLDFPVIGDFFFVVRTKNVFMGIRAYDPQKAGELIPLLQKVGRGLPGTIAVAKQSSLFERGLSSGRTIDVELIGPELTKLVSLGGQVMGKVGELMPEAQARPVPSLDLSSPEIHVEPKLLQSAEMNTSSQDLGYTVNALIDGAYAGDYYLGGTKIDLTIVGRTKILKNTQDVKVLPVATPLGQVVPLEALADIFITSGPEQILHRERQRAITIEISPPPTVPMEEAMEMIQTQIIQPMEDAGQLKGGYRTNLTGTADKLRDTWQALRFNIGLALLITYLLMAALFESWIYPMVIIFSVPLGAVGGVLGLFLLNQFILQPLDVLTMLGFVILIGTVVNNPILIVHQSLNHMREDHMQPREAILESVKTRIRPIFMTTTTTVLGLLPLVLFPGSGSELYRGLGSVVLGGLVVSTVFTLLLVPTLFSLTMDIRNFITNLFLKKAPQVKMKEDQKEQDIERLAESTLNT